MWFLHRVMESNIFMNQRKKVLFAGRVLLLWWVLMQDLCLSSMVVVSRSCQLLRFAMRLWLWVLDQTLSWRETLLKTHPGRRLMWHAHTRNVLPELSVKKRFVVPSADVADSLDVVPDDCGKAGNVMGQEEVQVNGVPHFVVFVAHGKPLNMHGCVGAGRRSVVRVTEPSGLLKQQGATVE